MAEVRLLSRLIKLITIWFVIGFVSSSNAEAHLYDSPSPTLSDSYNIEIIDSLTNNPSLIHQIEPKANISVTDYDSVIFMGNTYGGCTFSVKQVVVHYDEEGNILTREIINSNLNRTVFEREQHQRSKGDLGDIKYRSILAENISKNDVLTTSDYDWVAITPTYTKTKQPELITLTPSSEKSWELPKTSFVTDTNLSSGIENFLFNLYEKSSLTLSLIGTTQSKTSLRIAGIYRFNIITFRILLSKQLDYFTQNSTKLFDKDHYILFLLSDLRQARWITKTVRTIEEVMIPA